jgi:threonine dehydrogenase-like Zn-dependent dehydrogenase
MSTTTAAALMEAAVLVAPRKFETCAVRVPEPGPGEIRIKLEGCGVCGSNLAMWEGTPWAQYPTEPGGMGHEGWGFVDALGADVTTLKAGERVAALSYRAFACYDVAKADECVVLPRELDGIPFPGEALGCGFNIFRRSDVQAGQWVAIVGIGFLGALLTKLAANMGARVIAISRRPYSREVARKMGAQELVPMDGHGQIIERVRELTDGAMCERVIEAVGKQWPLDLAGELAGTRARLVVAGYHQDGPRQVNMQQWNWKGLDVINAHERDPRVYVQGMREAVGAVVSGELDPRPLCTHVYPLSRLGEALDATLNRPQGFLKALVSYE